MPVGELAQYREMLEKEREHLRKIRKVLDGIHIFTPDEKMLEVHKNACREIADILEDAGY